jgi:flagellar biosynthesis/type III secretory pathway M-ring protein FliF/YscJ
VASVKAQIANPLEGLSQLPVGRRIALIIALVGVGALGFSVLLWSQQPPYGSLHGRLSHVDAVDMEHVDAHFAHARRLEELYVRRIEGLLTPMFGAAGVRAQVMTELDFTLLEQFPQNVEAGWVDVHSARAAEKESRTRATSPIIQRISAAVLVDHRVGVDEQGNPARMPVSEEELARMTRLVQGVIGFKAERGDSVHIVNSAFLPADALDQASAAPWRQPWFGDALKQLAGLLLVVLILLVLRRILSERRRSPAHRSESLAVSGGGLLNPGAAPLPTGEQYQEMLSKAKEIAAGDPKRVAQVLKNWINSNE